MDMQTGHKSIRQAVHEGSLVDVTELAKKAYFPFAMFLTPFVVDLYTKHEFGLFVRIFFAVEGIRQIGGIYDVFDTWKYSDHLFIFEPHAEYGCVAVGAEYGKLEELDLERVNMTGWGYSM